MGAWIEKTYFDPDGALSIPEVVATCAAVWALFGSVYDYFIRAAHFDIQGFGAGLGALICALGAAQRLRDGKTNDTRGS
jgi:hypothetical protein